MAATATAAAATSVYGPPDFRTVAVVPKIGYVNIRRRVARSKFCICSSSEGDEISTTTTTNETEEKEEESTVEVKEEPQFFVSALNVEKAMRGIPISGFDYYGTLGLQRGCSYDEVTVAYKKKLEQVMNEGLDEEECGKRVDLLKESHSILSSVEDRRLYDWSLSRNGNPETYVWPFEVDITQTPTELPPPQEEEDVGPTRAVGYFLLGWIVLAFALSIALNR
ncbi:NAD(P)H-quinone oxidoreductase subunit U, chloroplastic [Heracleum sosnowskyi]|uniref:NAD(P)H-quinone oxidoreductase subunit U, chloroplastic n=1 Tax=Heracleum sosnowskyi TaxID=360622 RepID=A0AAD8HNF1_9APIA|nr:NAD(P)H-quinone oxidoreductase subunit U, chloroplastic [Heracleum sosnowskyi]